VQQVHDHHGRAVVLHDVVDLHDVRVADGAGRTRLAEETCAQGGIAGALGQKHLERHLLVRDRVGRGPYHPHPARADQAIEDEAPRHDGASRQLSQDSPYSK